MFLPEMLSFVTKFLGEVLMSSVRSIEHTASHVTGALSTGCLHFLRLVTSRSQGRKRGSMSRVAGLYPPSRCSLACSPRLIALQGEVPLTVPLWSVWFLGGWNLDKFLQQYGLRDPDTSTQFMTQFDEELSSEFGRINDDQEQFNQK